MANVAFENIQKIYAGATPALTDFNLHIADGETLALVGPSGCGKSTLLRLLAGLEQPSAGVLRINDVIANDQPPQQRNIAMVFQDYALYPHLTVRENLAFPLKMRRLPRTEVEKQMQWAAQLLNLGELLNRLPRQLSGGQRQRVAMGRALVREPSVFLMDEPLSNLDARLRSQIRSELSELLGRLATTTVYVTHDQAEAMTLGQRVAVLNHGRLQQVATPQELYEQPANTFVASFIGNPPMSIVPVQLTTNSDGRLRLTLGEQSLPAPDYWRPWLGQSLHVGIRPEYLSVTGQERGLRAVVYDAEYLGHETLLYLRIDGAAPNSPHVTARLSGIRIFQRSEVVRVLVNTMRLHLFDGSGLALDHGRALGWNSDPSR